MKAARSGRLVKQQKKNQIGNEIRQDRIYPTLADWLSVDGMLGVLGPPKMIPFSIRICRTFSSLLRSPGQRVLWFLSSPSRSTPCFSRNILTTLQCLFFCLERQRGSTRDPILPVHIYTLFPEQHPRHFIMSVLRHQDEQSLTKASVLVFHIHVLLLEQHLLPIVISSMKRYS